MSEQKPKILVIDDERLICELLKRYLEKRGYEVTFFTDGREGLKAIEKTTFNLALIDIIMPALSGIEVIKQLKQVAPGLVFIGMSGSLDETGIAAVSHLGAAGFISKPFDLPQLAAFIASKIRPASLAGGPSAPVQNVGLNKEFIPPPPPAP